MAISSDERLNEVYAIIDSIDDSAPASVRQEVFNFIRKWWTEVGESVELRNRVCTKLRIGPAQFNMLLMNPSLAFGAETLHKSLKPGWLKDYLDYTSGHEAPEDFHVWVGLTIIGAAIRRRAWIDNVYHKFYPNLYTILISPPGIGKKTTAINIGADILREAVPECRIISEKCTPEALAKRLSKPMEIHKESGGLKIEARAEGIILAPELTVFLGSEQYNSGLIMFLTRLYDCSKVLEIDTISRGTEKLKEVCVSLLGATTPSEIDRAIPSSARGGGFMSRLCLVQKDSTSRIVAKAVKTDPTIRELLVIQLGRIYNECVGEFKLTDEADKWYEEYYKRHHEVVAAGNTVMSIERQPDHLKKIAMILSAAEHCGMSITEDHLQRAFNIIEIAAQNCGDILKMIDTSERGKMTQLVLNIISQAGGMCGRSFICRKVYRHMNGAELDMCLRTLEEAGLVAPFRNEKKQFYKLVKLEES
jgi:DNA polymerase III delta prime subunit